MLTVDNNSVIVAYAFYLRKPILQVNIKFNGKTQWLIDLEEKTFGQEHLSFPLQWCIVEKRRDEDD